MRKGMLVLFVSVAMVFGACGGDDDEDATGDDTAAVDTDDGADDNGGGSGGGGITIEGFKFNSATAAPGAEVSISNQDGSAHTVTADNDEFDSGNIDGNGSGSITAPDEAGQYAYHCQIHPNMKGTLTVAG